MSPFWRRTPMWAYAASVLVVLVGVGLIGWTVVAGRAAGQVHVAWLPDASTCTRHALGRAPKDTGIHGPVLYARPGMICSLRVQVVNESSRPVRVDSLIGDLLGRQSSHVLTAINAADGGQPVGERLAAYWPVNETIAPGHTARYNIGVGYRSSGCDSRTGFLAVGGFPTAHLTVLGRGYTRAAPTSLQWTQRGPATGCH